MENFDLILKILGYAGVAGVQTWLIVKYLMDRQDRKEAGIYTEINKIKETFVRKDDHNRQMDQINSSLNNISVTVNTRLDSILLMMGNRNNGSQK